MAYGPPMLRSVNSPADGGPRLNASRLKPRLETADGLTQDKPNEQQTPLNRTWHPRIDPRLSANSNLPLRPVRPEQGRAMRARHLDGSR